MSENIEIRQSFFDTEKELNQLVELQNEVYKERGKTFHQEGFRHWYVENPYGNAISFNAFDGEKMVAHYVCIIKKMVIEGRVVDGILSMATVTHPDYRGRGLFKTLAKMTYDYAKNHGYEFVIGVANANSFPGFMKYFPFQFVGRLEFKVGYGRHIKAEQNKTFAGYWDEEALKWRCRKTYKQSGDTIIGLHGSFARTLVGYFDEHLLSKFGLPKAGVSIKPVLYIGLGGTPQGLFVNMPKVIKHSPFNLIFMDLTDGELPKMTKDNVFFQLFDFDVA
ncbi:MAG: GNAT family N-acetyltransferase [Bacteroidales bacterium]|nr:GNAT family N-acetyltransferase [Bacteroidales bacterium]